MQILEWQHLNPTVTTEIQLVDKVLTGSAHGELGDWGWLERVLLREWF
jgi:hypothetical protein